MIWIKSRIGRTELKTRGKVLVKAYSLLKSLLNDCRVINVFQRYWELSCFSSAVELTGYHWSINFLKNIHAFFFISFFLSLFLSPSSCFSFLPYSRSYSLFISSFHLVLPLSLPPFPYFSSLPLSYLYNFPLTQTETLIPSCCLSCYRYFDTQLPKENSPSLLKIVGFVGCGWFCVFSPLLSTIGTHSYPESLSLVTLFSLHRKK